MASNAPAADGAPSNDNTQMQLVPAPAVSPHPAVTSTSLPHLGDFINKLLEDAYKAQNLSAELEKTNIELEQTKKKLREAESRIAELEIDVDTIKKNENALKAQLGVQEAALSDKDKALSKSIPKSKIDGLIPSLEEIRRYSTEHANLVVRSGPFSSFHPRFMTISSCIDILLDDLESVRA